MVKAVIPLGSVAADLTAAVIAASQVALPESGAGESFVLALSLATTLFLAACGAVSTVRRLARWESPEVVTIEI